MVPSKLTGGVNGAGLLVFLGYQNQGPYSDPDQQGDKHVLILRTISRYNQKSDTTAQLYCTLSMCVIPKTIFRQNQITNTPPQLYCTLSSTCVCRSKPFSRQNQKLTQHNSTTQQHNWKKGSSSPREASVFVSPSVILSVSKGQEIRVKECKPY